MECINEPLLNWCLEGHAESTRTRPYHKNDTVGYFRFDIPAEYAALLKVF